MSTSHAPQALPSPTYHTHDGMGHDHQGGETVHVHAAATMPPPVTVVQAERNGLGTASFVLGLIAALVGLGPVIGAIIALPCGFVGLALGLANIGRLRKGKATNKWMTVTGITLCVLGVTFGIIASVMFNHAVHGLNGTQ